MPSIMPTPATNIFSSSLPSIFRRKKQSYDMNPPEPSCQVIYLGNVLTAGLGKGEASVERPLGVIWRMWNASKCRQNKENKLNSQPIRMSLCVTRSGLKTETKQLGLTEYWSHRITFCLAPQQYPRVFCWIYKHEGKRMKPELRCHAVLCKRPNEPERLERLLNQYLQAALQEYKREKLASERARKNSLLLLFSKNNVNCPRRKQLLLTGSVNFRPQIKRSNSEPRLVAIDEEEEQIDEKSNPSPTKNVLLNKENVSIDVNDERINAEEAQNIKEKNLKGLEANIQLVETEDNEMYYSSSSDIEDSLNLDYHYRNMPMLSGDTSSQNSVHSSTPSSSINSCSSCEGRHDCNDNDELNNNFTESSCSDSYTSTSSNTCSNNINLSNNSSAFSPPFYSNLESSPVEADSVIPSFRAFSLSAPISKGYSSTYLNEMNNIAKNVIK
ncbi:PID domain-containing protein [Meloidogyne graminicola]|uniref:PID domain-containing protein n=1 Tax=Meloidogyne graminicola TaxID=189291 RepID=A0A8S9Z7Q9_9BILA|nr:PID domain-containing protein [Meloidogyne graminicola]